MSPRPAPRVAALAVAVAALIAATAASSAGASPAVTMPGVVTGLAAQPDGSLKAVVLTPAGAAADPDFGPPPSYATLRTIDPAGTLLPAAPSAPPADPARLGAYEVAAAILPDGSALTAWRDADRARDEGIVAARALAPDGTPGPVQQLSTPGRNAGAGGGSSVAAVAGPTGAVAVTFVQQQGRRSLSRLAFRRPGAATFAPPITLGGLGGVLGLNVRVFLGPDGGGMVLRLPDDDFERGAVSLRRLTPEGRLGRPIKLGLERSYGAEASGVFTAKGTFALATRLTNRTRQDEVTKTWFLTVGPRTTRATRPMLLPRSGGDELSGAHLALAVHGERITLMTRARDRAFLFYSGTPGHLKAASRLPVYGLVDARLIALPGRLVAPVWLGSVTSATDVRVLTSRGRPTGRFPEGAVIDGFPVPEPTGGFGSSGNTLGNPVLLPDGRIAVAYNAEPGDERTLRSGVVLTSAPG